ncbi:MAG: helix-turn-helix transcriptional regulator [Chloroflexi bacterium]|nr:helix-turn-helix transcriptional regulator [Chloroflexota bacterium]
MERANLAEILKAAREQKHLTQTEAAEAVGVTLNSWHRWETGQQEPHAYNLRRIEEVFGLNLEELGLTPQLPVVKRVPDREDIPVEEDVLTAFRMQDLSSCLMRIVWDWLYHHYTKYHELQACIGRILEEHIILNKDTDLISRRDALRRLASLPIDYCYLSAFAAVLKRPIEEILTQCAAGITACWYLRKGKELAFTAQAVESYVPTLKAITESSQKEQCIAAADLLAQCLILQSQLANQFDNRAASLNYAKQAEQYSEAAGNIALQIVAIRTQANAYDFAHDWKQALQTAVRASLLLKTNKDNSSNKHTPIPPLVASQVYASLGNYQGHAGLKQDALYSLGEAHTKFYETSDEPVPVWITLDEGHLLLNDGLAHLYLDLHREARNSFEQVVACDTPAETARVEALISQVTAETHREDAPRDMDYCIDRWTQGMQGAIAMQSDHWFNAALTTLTAMRVAWPGEKAVKDLREHIVHW